MSPVEILALALAASVGVAAVTGLAALAAERVSDDPVWRDRLWSGAFWQPAATPVLTALFLLAPKVAPEPVVVSPFTATGTVLEPTGALTAGATAASTGSVPFDVTLLALLVLSVAGVLAMLRLYRLVRRARRLSVVIARAEHPSPELAAMVGAPDRPGQSLTLRVSPDVSEPLLAGLLKPVLILPASVVGSSRDQVQAVVAHEMAHLRRRDLTAMWLEEAALTVLAANPLLAMLHARRRIAREEACDALALAGATTRTRRAYARTLIDALRDRAGIEQGVPALTFTGRRGAAALRRVRAILEPRPAVGRLTRRLTLAVGALAAGLVFAGSFALAGQTEADGPLIIDLDSHQSPAAQQWEMINAAIDPVFTTAWPGACGYSLDEADRLTIHLQRCDGSDSPDQQVLALQGRDPAASPREAFEAVKAACDAGGLVTIDYRLGDRRASKAVACAKPARAPAPTRVLDLAIAWDGVAPRPGDRLHVTLGRDGGGELELNHVVGLPAVAPAGLRTRSEEDFLMIGRAPRLRAILISKEGVVRAVSRPVTLPMSLGENSATTEIVMEPGSAEAISDTSGWRRVQRLRAEGLSDEQAWRAAAEPE